MIITKKALRRRTFLRGVGASVALPWLEAMVPAFPGHAQTAADPLRLGFIYLPNGVSMSFVKGIDYWRPNGEGTNFELSPILKPLAPFRDQLVVVSGLRHGQAEQLDDGATGDHTRGTCTWLNGVHPKRTEGADVRSGTTVDQIAAQVLGEDRAVRSLELAIDLNFLVGMCENGYSCAYMNTLAWRDPTTPLPTENNPRVVFERLFGDGGSPQQRLTQMRQNRSLLDSVLGEMNDLQRTLGPSDRAKVRDYFDAVREVETRLQNMEAKAGTSELPALQRPTGIPVSFVDHVKLMYDLQWLAFQSDTTRVVTFMLGRELGSRTYPEIGVTEGHHQLSHHRGDPEKLARYAKVNALQTQLFAYFLEKLRGTREGNGTLLDHSLFLYGAGLSDPNEHAHDNIPLCLMGGAGGRLRGGRHLVYPNKTPMTNLLLTVLEMVGGPVDTLGDSTGRLDLESPARVVEGAAEPCRPGKALGCPGSPKKSVGPAVPRPPGLYV